MIAVGLAFAAAALGAMGAGALLGSAGHTAGRGRGARMVELLVVTGRRAARSRRPPLELERRIAAAGSPLGLGPREVLAIKLAAAVAGGALGAAVAMVAPGRLGLIAGVAGPCAGFLAPDLWLVRRAADRARAARRSLPGMLDLLRVTVAAGVALPAGLAEVGSRSTGPLAAEWRRVGRQTELGVPLSEALVGMAGRLPQPEVAALAAALERARRHGAPLERTLAAQARDARAALRRGVQEDAARAGPKIQLVVALMLVPSVLLLVAAGLASALLDSGGVPGT